MCQVLHAEPAEVNIPPHSVVFLPRAFPSQYGSPFETTLHDDAYGAFMTPPLYTCIREDDEYMILEDTVRYFSMQVVQRDRKGVNSTRSQVTWTSRMLVHTVNARKPKTKQVVQHPIG